MIKPPHFDPAKKYPVFTYIYGEPASQTVVDVQGGYDLYLRAIAREGYVVLSFDNQGTPAPSRPRLASCRLRLSWRAIN